MFRFKIPDALNPRLVMERRQAELRRQHDAWQADLADAGPKPDFVVMPVSPDEARRQRAEQLRQPEVDVDGVLEAAPMRVLDEAEQRRQESMAARLRREYNNQKRGIR